MSAVAPPSPLILGTGRATVEDAVAWIADEHPLTLAADRHAMLRALASDVRSSTDEGPAVMTTQPRSRTSETNPGGISFTDAVRGLKAAGYDDQSIWQMIEVIGPDCHSEKRWRWRTETVSAFPTTAEIELKRTPA